MRVLVALLLVLASAGARAQSLSSPGWSWIETLSTSSFDMALRQAQTLKLEFPQVVVAEKRGQFVVSLAILRDRNASREAETLLRENRVAVAITDSGEHYSRILYGVNPFTPDVAYSLGFPKVSPADANAPYLQLASRIALSQAIDLAAATRAKGVDATVVLMRNGWFAIVVPPSPRNARLLASLKHERKVPADSVAVAGSNFVEAVWAPSMFRPDERLVALYPELKYADARAALAAGDGATALRMLQNEYRRAGSADYALAADILRLGLGGVRANPEQAAIWLNACLPTGVVKCYVALAAMTESGVGVPKDARRAASLYRTAAAKGDPRAQFQLAVMLILGEGAVQDYEEGARLLRLSATSGMADAQQILGMTYMSGGPGRRNLPLAYFWLSLAAASLDAGADRDKAVKDRNEVAGKIGSARVLEIQKLARSWTPGEAEPSLEGDEPESGGPTVSASEAGKPTPAKASESVAKTGSGFFIDKDGRFVTNAHVVKACTTITASNATGATAPATLISVDETNDLALLQTPAPPPAVAQIRIGAKLGENVAVFGFPFRGLLSSGGNFTTGNIVALSGMRDDSRHFQVSAPVQPGNSGGPLVDGYGNVIGVVVAKADAMRFMEVVKDVPQNVNFAIKSTTLASFLDAKQASYDSIPANTALASEELAERARMFAVLVACQ